MGPYSDTPAKERAADYKAESDNAGLLSLRNAEGLTSSWLACGSEKGGQNGKYAARVWRDLSEKYYFEISFSTKEYSNIKLAAAVGDDFNAHSIVNAEYSIDGQTYTKFGTYTLPYRAWLKASSTCLPTLPDKTAFTYVHARLDFRARGQREQPRRNCRCRNICAG